MSINNKPYTYRQESTFEGLDLFVSSEFSAELPSDITWMNSQKTSLAELPSEITWMEMQGGIGAEFFAPRSGSGGATSPGGSPGREALPIGDHFPLFVLFSFVYFLSIFFRKRKKKQNSLN